MKYKLGTIIEGNKSKNKYKILSFDSKMYNGKSKTIYNLLDLQFATRRIVQLGEVTISNHYKVICEGKDENC